MSKELQQLGKDGKYHPVRKVSLKEDSVAHKLLAEIKNERAEEKWEDDTTVEVHIRVVHSWHNDGFGNYGYQAIDKDYIVDKNKYKRILKILEE